MLTLQPKRLELFRWCKLNYGWTRHSRFSSAQNMNQFDCNSSVSGLTPLSWWFSFGWRVHCFQLLLIQISAMPTDYNHFSLSLLFVSKCHFTDCFVPHCYDVNSTCEEMAKSNEWLCQPHGTKCGIIKSSLRCRLKWEASALWQSLTPREKEEPIRTLLNSVRLESDLNDAINCQPVWRLNDSTAF